MGSSSQGRRGDGATSVVAPVRRLCTGGGASPLRRCSTYRCGGAHGCRGGRVQRRTGSRRVCERAGQRGRRSGRDERLRCHEEKDRGRNEKDRGGSEEEKDCCQKAFR